MANFKSRRDRLDLFDYKPKDEYESELIEYLRRDAEEQTEREPYMRRLDAALKLPPRQMISEVNAILKEWERDRPWDFEPRKPRPAEMN